MIIFSQFFEKKADLSKPVAEGGFNYHAVILQMKTGEGKSIVIAMLAIFVKQLLSKRVHILENNEGLLMRDHATYKPFYELFGMTVADHIDESSDICYCLKKANNRFFNEKLAAGSLNLDEVILIVDEVDDLVVNEKPLANYMKPDVRETPAYKQCFEVLKEGGTTCPSGVKGHIWKRSKDIKDEAGKKVEGHDFARTRTEDGVERFEILDEDRRLPKVPLTEDWLEYHCPRRRPSHQYMRPTPSESRLHEMHRSKS
jgi:hypothetical protein